MNLPQFTIVVPHKDRPGLLARAVDSVLKQDIADWELVVVDDGSTGPNLEAVKAVLAEIARAQLLVNECSKGGSVSRNRAIEASSGSYVAFLDSDDWWTPTHLSSHLRALQASNALLSYNSALLVRSDSFRQLHVQGKAPNCNLRPSAEILGHNFIGGCSSVCVTRQAFDSVGGFRSDLASCQDWELWIRVLGLADPAYIAESSTFQDVGEHERITTNREKVESGHVEIFRIASSADLTLRERRFVQAHNFRVQAELAARFGEHGKAAALAARSLSKHGTFRDWKRLADHLWHWIAR